SEDRVVGEDEELLAGRLERGDELVGARDGTLLVDEHTVHVRQPALHRFGLGHRAIVIVGARRQTAAMEMSGYRVLWRTRGVTALLASSLLARLPVLATLVPVSFLAKDLSGSFRWAGVVAGAYAVGMAIAGPVWARMADRRGPR